MTEEEIKAAWQSIQVAVTPLAEWLQDISEYLTEVFSEFSWFQRQRATAAKNRARLVTWHKGNKKRLTRREKVARGIPSGRYCSLQR